MMTAKRHITTIVNRSISGVLLASLLAGCCSAPKNRNVRGAALPIPSSGAQAADLLVTNWEPGRDTETIYVTYTVKDGNARKVRWEQEIAEYDGSHSPRAIFDESRVYYLAADRVLAFGQEDGSIAWETALSDLVSTSCERCIRKIKGHIVVVTMDYVLQGIDTRSGEMDWSVRLNDSTIAYDGFSVVGDQVVLLDRTEPEGSDKAIHVFSPDSGLLVRTISPTCPNADHYSPWPEEMFIDRASGSGRVILLYDCGADPFVQSWTLAGGEEVWQEPLPEETNYSHDPFLIGRDTLYLGTSNGLFGTSLATGQTRRLSDLDPDYDVTLLAEHEGIILAHARRTRGSTRHEMWGLSASGERKWQYEMQADRLSGVESGSADSAYRFTADGLLLIQVLDDPEEHLSALLLDPQNGQVIRQSEIAADVGSMSGVAWDSYTAYVTTWGDLYAVDLETLAITLEWP